MSDLYADYFVKPANEYKRDNDVLKHYVADAVTFLSISTGKSVEECATFVRTNLKQDGRFPYKDPTVEFLERQENGDRERKSTTLRRYIHTSLMSNEIIAPTFTTYVDPHKDKSLLGIYVEQNIVKRGKAKKEQFAAKAAGNKVLEALKKIEQTGRKLGNNALSGAHVSASTPLFNKTAHSTLTSTCRISSGYGNANNEKFLSGNRHYFDYQVVLNNIVAIVNSTDYAILQQVMDKYYLHYPTTEDTMNCILYSSTQYWWDRSNQKKIEDLVDKLTPIQRASFVYSGDAHHLLKHNPDMMRVFITRLSDRVTGTHSNPMEPLKKAPDGYINLAHQICYKETMGIGKDYSRIADSEKIHTLALTVENIAKTIVDYSDLIRALWMPEILPASISHFPDSVRRSAITSDTDSTIFTVQDWAIWYSGKLSFDDRSKAVYAAMVFLASATITHVLAKMSANLGIIEEQVFKIQMKSEFSFDVFVNTSLGKHYFSAISCQEGNVFKEFDWEIKGAQLRSANAPRETVAAAKKMMQKIINDTVTNGKIVLFDYLREVANMEREVEASLRKGELKFLRNGSVKDMNSYANEAEESPYQNYLFWEEVFAPKYGKSVPPPYNTKKIPVNIDTSAKMKAWIAGIKDLELKDRLVSYLTRNEKNFIGVFNLPTEILVARGIPEEIVEVIDFEKLQLDICRIFYIILETLGYYAVGDKSKKLLSRNGF